MFESVKRGVWGTGYWMLDAGSLFKKPLRVAGCALRVQATILCLEKWHGVFIYCLGIGSSRCWILDAGYWILDAGYWILDTGCWKSM